MALLERRGALASLAPSVIVAKLRFSFRAVVARPTTRRSIIINLVAFWGATATAVQIGLWVTNSEEIPSGPLFTVAVAIGSAVVVWRSLPSADLRMAHRSFAASFEISCGDIFALDAGTIAVTTNRQFDHHPDEVAAESLISQLVERWFDGDRAPLSAAVEPYRSRTDVQAGCVVPVSAGERTALLLAVTERNEAHRSSVLVGDIAAAEWSLWDAARQRDLKELTVPLIGSGFARAQVGALPLLMLLLTSYITASMEVPVCHLRIVLHEDAVEVSTAVDVCYEYARALGFVKR